jgi:hypothetical protein
MSLRHLVALERIGERLVEARLQIYKPPGRVVLSQLRFALARHSALISSTGKRQSRR